MFLFPSEAFLGVYKMLAVSSWWHDGRYKAGGTAWTSVEPASTAWWTVGCTQYLSDFTGEDARQSCSTCSSADRRGVLSCSRRYAVITLNVILYRSCYVHGEQQSFIVTYHSGFSALIYLFSSSIFKSEKYHRILINFLRGRPWYLEFGMF